MRTSYVISVTFLLYQSIFIVCPPVDQAQADLEDDHVVTNETDPLFSLEYGRYLSEVVKVLETDKQFAEKLKNVSEDDIKSGHIANHLELVNHNVRSKLDELKRIEMDRLRKLTIRKNELEHGIDRQNVINDHVDQDNQHKFEVEDLKKLIQAATRDLEKIHDAEKEEFKQYEMEKEFEFQQGIKNMTEDQKKVEIKNHEEEKHKKHPAAHHPGSKAQLEQVWQEQDHMENQDFDPKTFFAMHDLNGDGVFDENEIEAILRLEVKRMYMSDPKHPGDPREMEEELNRMREHVFKEVDKDKDGLVSEREFLDMTATQEFQHDEGWKGLDEQQPVYTQEELQKFMMMREHELQMQMQAQGYGYHPGAPPNLQYHNGYAPPGGIPMNHPQAGYQAYPQGVPHGVPQGVPHGVPQGVPQGYQGYAAPPQVNQGYPPQGNPAYVQHPNQGYVQPPQGNQGYGQHPPMNQGNPAPPQGQQQLPPPKVTVGQHANVQQGSQQNFQQPPAQNFQQGQNPQQGQNFQQGQNSQQFNGNQQQQLNKPQQAPQQNQAPPAMKPPVPNQPASPQSNQQSNQYQQRSQ